MVKNCIAALAISLLTLSRGFALEPSREECKQSALSILPKIPGWCSPKKASAMMDLIFSTNPAVCVEIGVFGGSSLFPTAIALKHMKKGKVYAIDPWNTAECLKCYSDPNDPNYKWWKNIDMEAIYRSFTNMIKNQRLEGYCTVLRATSAEAAPKIGTIDILHIDGNHCDASALIDVMHYIPKVKRGGHIWFDGWSSASEAFDFVKKTCHVKQVIDTGRYILLEKVSD